MAAKFSSHSDERVGKFRAKNYFYSCRHRVAVVAAVPMDAANTGAIPVVFAKAIVVTVASMFKVLT